MAKFGCSAAGARVYPALARPYRQSTARCGRPSHPSLTPALPSAIYCLVLNPNWIHSVRLKCTRRQIVVFWNTSLVGSSTSETGLQMCGQIWEHCRSAPSSLKRRTRRELLLASRRCTKFHIANNKDIRKKKTLPTLGPLFVFFFVSFARLLWFLPADMPVASAPLITHDISTVNVS